MVQVWATRVGLLRPFCFGGSKTFNCRSRGFCAWGGWERGLDHRFCSIFFYCWRDWAVKAGPLVSGPEHSYIHLTFYRYGTFKSLSYIRSEYLCLGHFKLFRWLVKKGVLLPLGNLGADVLEGQEPEGGIPNKGQIEVEEAIPSFMAKTAQTPLESITIWPIMELGMSPLGGLIVRPLGPTESSLSFSCRSSFNTWFLHWWLIS